GARATMDGWKYRDTIDVMTYGDAIDRADVTILAIPFSSATATLIEHRDRFRAGALVVDVMVPLIFTGGKVSLADVPEGSAAEHVRAHLPPAVHVAATFKTLPAHILDD